MRFFSFFFKNHFLLKIIFWFLINLTIRGPLYTCLVSLEFEKIVYTVADSGKQEHCQTLKFCILEDGIWQRFQSYSTVIDIALTELDFYFKDSIMFWFWYLNLTSKWLTNFTNLIHYRHFGALHWKTTKLIWEKVGTDSKTENYEKNWWKTDILK